MRKVVVVEDVGKEVLVSDLGRAKEGIGFGKARRRTFPAANTKNLKLKKGDFVEIFLPIGKTVLQTAIIFLLPLILFLTAYRVVAALVSGAGEGILLLAGFGALLLGFPLAAFLCRVAGARLPTISRVLASENALEFDDCSGCGMCLDFDCRMRE